MSEKILSLDISTKTGWSIATVVNNEYKLIEYGLLPKTEKPEKDYPGDYVQWAINTVRPIIAKIEEAKADIVVIEETAKGSKNNFSQKILEFVHYLVAEYVSVHGVKTKYLMTGEWREAVEARLSATESKQNKKSKQIKEKTGTKLAKDENGKVLGRITKKHVNVRRANEIFGLNLKLKQNDEADGLLLGFAYYQYKYNNFKRKKERDAISGTKTKGDGA